jgi:hypothetical protein
MLRAVSRRVNADGNPLSHLSKLPQRFRRCTRSQDRSPKELVEHSQNLGFIDAPAHHRNGSIWWHPRAPILKEPSVVNAYLVWHPGPLEPKAVRVPIVCEESSTVRAAFAVDVCLLKFNQLH